MSRCATCGHENQAGAKFCSECGAGMAEVATAAREERKVVTVLFADLVGFTARSERLDPEDVRALLSPYYERLRGELERFGGTVEKFIGDAVMALFGAPIAHEDDPERAVSRSGTGCSTSRRTCSSVSPSMRGTGGARRSTRPGRGHGLRGCGQHHREAAGCRTGERHPGG